LGHHAGHFGGKGKIAKMETGTP